MITIFEDYIDESGEDIFKKISYRLFNIVGKIFDKKYTVMSVDTPYGNPFFYDLCAKYLEDDVETDLIVDMILDSEKNRILINIETMFGESDGDIHNFIASYPNIRQGRISGGAPKVPFIYVENADNFLRFLTYKNYQKYRTTKRFDL